MAEQYFIKKIENIVGFTEPSWLKIKDHIYILIDNPEHVKIIKTDLQLNTIWSKEYSYKPFESVNSSDGFSNSFIINDGIVDDEGNILFVGKRFTGYSVEKGILFKITSEGEFLWFKQSINGSYSYDYIKQLNDNLFFVFNNSFYNSTGNPGAFLLFDKDGNNLKSLEYDFLEAKTTDEYNTHYNVAITDNYIIMVAAVFLGSPELGDFEIPHNYQHFVKLDHDLNIIEAFFIDINGASDIKYDNISISVFNDEIIIYTKEYVTNVLYASKLPLENSQTDINTVSYKLLGLAEETKVYFSEVNSEATFVFYYEGRNTICYKFDHNLKPLWKKQINKSILEIVSLEGEVLTSFFNSEGDTVSSFCRMNLNFQFGSCLDINKLPLDAEETILSNSFSDSDFQPKILSAPIEQQEFNFLYTQDIDGYSIDTICTYLINYDLNQSIITTNPKTIDADGESTSTIIVQLKDFDGANLNEGGETVIITTNVGTISATTDNNDGTYTAILTSSTVAETATISFTVNGENAVNTANVLFVSVNKVECPAHVALLIDESTSISETEAAQIRNGLQEFIDAQLGSNLVVSLIAMSTTDQNTREDHIIEQKVTANTKQLFDAWITGYRNRGAGSGSDKWASAIEVFDKLSTIPDITIAIADGLITQNVESLLSDIKRVNNKSHLFVYAIKMGFYDNGVDTIASRDIEESLAFYLDRTPIPSTQSNDILITDYQKNILDFTKLGEALSGLNNALIEAEVGCGNISLIGTNFTDIRLRPNDAISNLQVGTLSFQNDKSVVHTLEAGTTIATSTGVSFTVLTTVQIPANGNGTAAVIGMGTPTESGNYSEVISIPGILNPNELSIDFTVLPVQVTCPAHVAFLVDESGSINNRVTPEIPEIREALRSFVELQKYSNLTISLIGLSNNDEDTRDDHVLEKLVDDETIGEFNSWLNGYRTNRVSSVSHHWSSGLNLATELNTTPDIIIIIADGANVSSNQVFLDAVKLANNKSHIFVYALSQGLYHNGINWSTRDLEDTLTFFFNRDLKPSTQPNDILITDYQQGINSFEDLGKALRSLNDALIEAEVGCGNIEITKTDFENITLYSREEVENIVIGTITLKNGKSSDHILETGTQLVSINGIIVTTVEEVVIGNFEEGIVTVQISGTPELNGEYEEIISIIGVLNPLELTVPFKVIPLEKILHTQSPFLYMQAAGSSGNDGTVKGVHLRWIFKNTLGDNHLPKGNEAANENGFNKKDDFVSVYKIPYEKKQIEINFQDKPNYASTNFRRFRNRRNTPFWVYELEGNRYVLHFDNVSQYIASANRIDPGEFPLEFLENYGNNLITLETRNSLAFSAEFILKADTPSASLQTELVGSEEKLLAKKKQGLVARKTFVSNEFSNTYQQGEDIKYIRFKTNNCVVEGLKLEMYSTLVDKANKEKLWEELGSFALTKDNDIAFERLEPSAGLIDGKWPRFNGGNRVNIDNYKNRWDNDKTEEFEKDIKQLVTDYITESNDQTNPSGKVSISFNEDVDDNSDAREIAYLDFLTIASTDYHVARMLGLGCFDLDNEVNDKQFIYAVKYTTKNEIENYVYAKDSEDFNVEHIYVSLPTSANEERLPRPYDITKIVPGVPKGDYEWTDEAGNVVPSTSLLDENGYSNNGKTRFVSIYSPDDEENELVLDFYVKSEQFNSSQFTEPVNGGIESKFIDDLDADETWTAPWDKTELLVSDEYLNKVDSGQPTYETIPLSIPDKNKALYVHMQREDGIYHYGTYGINWFSRVSPVENKLFVKTEFVPDNLLLPPNNINVLNIVEERPLLLTSVNEQNLLNTAIGTDKDAVLVRLAFNYNSSQELKSYKITDELEQKAIIKFPDINSNQVLYQADAVVKDEKEIFADDVEIFFRNELPRNIQGKVNDITNDPTDERISIITTQKYVLFSSSTDTGEQEILNPVLPIGASVKDFEGGVFTTDGESFFIKSIVDNTDSVTIHVYKNDADKNVQTSILPSPDASLIAPIAQADALFMVVENMSADQSWGSNNPNQSFKVQLTTPESETIHREIIEIKEGADDEPERILEKTRGFWGNAKIEEVNQDTENEDGSIVSKHLGLYKIAMDYTLSNHPQNDPDSKGNFVNWNGGVVRIHTNNDPKGPRRVLNVIRIENLGNASENVIVYAKDDLVTTVIKNDEGDEVPNDAILTGNNIEVNFYPGFKAYLYKDASFNLTKESITPTNEFLKYSIFGLRTVDNHSLEKYGSIYKSPISAPATMFVHKIIDPLQPEEPKGALYATKPDSFGKATYTLTSAFKHEPYGVMYYRANDRSILGALYTHETVHEIITKLESYNPDIFYTNRWEDLFNFETDRTAFEIFPKTGSNGFRFPMPNKPRFFNEIDVEITYANDKYDRDFDLVKRENFDLKTVVIPAIESENLPAKTIADFVELAVMNAFVSLTEVPLLYDHIEGETYQPIAKRQVVRDRDGNLLAPTHPDYDASPMAKRIKPASGSFDEVLFTDFKLDGTSKNTYFYTSREMGSTTQVGPFSAIKGPVKLVNTKAPENPEIKRVLPILANSNFDYELKEFTFEDIENISLNSEFRSLYKSGGTEWEAGTASQQILRGNTYATFSVTEGTEVVIGFSSFNQSTHFSTIQYGLHIKPNNRLHVVLQGKDLGEVGTYDIEAIFKIEIKGNRIFFYRDEVKVFEEQLIKATDFVLDISMKNSGSLITNLNLYSIANSFTTEEIVGNDIPLSLINKTFIQENDNVISKDAGLGNDAWDAGAHSEIYLPYYGAISFKVKANTGVMIGLANELIGQQPDNVIDYALLTKEDGYLYVAINGTEITDKCVRYDSDSLLEIERRNNYLIFKKNQRPFFELPLVNNEPLFLDFSMLSADSEIVNLKMTALNEIVKNYDTSIINPALSFEVNAYQPDQRIRKLSLYRTTKPENSLSVRTMDLVNSIDLVLTNQLDNNILTIKDEFLDMDFVPYSDPLYYRVTVSRELEYAKPNTEPPIIVSEYQPSKSSKLLISSIVESTSPQAPELTYSFDVLESNDTLIDNIILKWHKTVHNGKYHVYNMNSQGNWVKIHEVISNDNEIQLFLGETNLDNALQIKDSEGIPKYYHFKIDAENSVGMLNVKSNIITIPGETGKTSLEGIGSMIIENTNLVR